MATKYGYVGKGGWSAVYLTHSDAWHRMNCIGRVSAVNYRREGRQYKNDGWEARLDKHKEIVGVGKTRDEAVDDALRQVPPEPPAIDHNEDLSGEYHEDRGDYCEVKKLDVSRYWVRCASGVNRTVSVWEVRRWIEKGWYTLIRRMNDGRGSA